MDDEKSCFEERCGPNLVRSMTHSPKLPSFVAKPEARTVAYFSFKNAPSIKSELSFKGVLEECLGLGRKHRRSRRNSPTACVSSSDSTPQAGQVLLPRTGISPALPAWDSFNALLVLSVNVQCLLEGGPTTPGNMFRTFILFYFPLK